MHDIDITSTSDMMASMTPENEQSAAVDAIHIDFRDRSITFEGRQGAIARLVLSDAVYLQTPIESPPEGLILPDEEDSGFQVLEDETSTAEGPAPVAEKEQPVVLSGRLKSQPREGRPDSQGHPTAWARLAVHEEGAPMPTCSPQRSTGAALESRFV